MENGKKLKRNLSNSMIGGVCSGFADYFSLDVSLVRVIWAVVSLFAGTGILAYIICWIVIPAKEIGE